MAQTSKEKQGRQDLHILDEEHERGQALLFDEHTGKISELENKILNHNKTETYAIGNNQLQVRSYKNAESEITLLTPPHLSSLSRS